MADSTRRHTIAAALTVGEVAERAGVSAATVRFYEEQGLISSTRTAGNQRRFARHVLRRIAVVKAAQQMGLTLGEIREALLTVAPDRAPTKAEWARLSTTWRALLDARITALEQLRDGLTDCIGCGCLSMSTCPLYNPEDALGREGGGARKWPARLRGDPSGR